LKNLVEKPNGTKESEEPSFETHIFKNSEDRDLIRSAVENIAQQLTSEGYDAVVLLDRGGRIFGHLLKEYWRSGGVQGSVHPEILFMNFGREKLEYSSQGAFVSPDKIVALSLELKESMGERFNGKKVAILDEDVATGNSVRGARTVFSLAYPGALLVDIGSFTAPQDKYPDFKLRPTIIKAGDQWLALPRAPCGPDASSIFITPMRKYLTERSDSIKNKLDKLSQCEKEESGKVDLAKRFEIIKDSLLDDNTFFNDFLYLHLDKIDAIEGLDAILDLHDALSGYSVSHLKRSITSKRESLESTRQVLEDYLSELKTFLVVERKILDSLLASCPQLQNSWNVAVREAKSLMHSKD